MKQLPDMPAAYWERFSVDPVDLKPFDPGSRPVARAVLLRLTDLLHGLEVEVCHRGSTLFGISGKGDIELGVYPPDQAWSETLTRLAQHYGQPGNVEDDYVRFNATASGYEIELIVLRGNKAVVDRALTDHLMAHPELLRAYEQLKRRYAYSRREYQRQKDKFFRSVVSRLK